MIIIGLVLLVAAAVVGLDLIWKNHYAVRSPALFGQTLGVHTAAELLIVGAIVGAAVLLGLAMMLAGTRRRAARARQHHTERREGKSAARDRDKAQKENDKLRRKLDHDDADAQSSGATAAD